MSIGPAYIAAILYKNMKNFLQIIMRAALHQRTFALTEFALKSLLVAVAADIAAPQEDILYVTTRRTMLKINIILERCLL